MAVNTTNGAGPHNIQMFFLSADGTVLHCLPGFWNPDDLVEEMGLADRLNAVWQNPKLTRATKNAMFTQMQLEHIKEHPPEMVARSQLQRFDQSFELSHAATSDFVIGSGAIQPTSVGWVSGSGDQLKTTDVVLHERMAVRPFLPYQNFDVAVFSNYGTRHYDKNEFNMQQHVAQMQARAGEELNTLGSRWGDPRQAEMFGRRREQLSLQMERQKEQLDKQFDPTREARIRPRMGVVQTYNWNNSGQQTYAPSSANPTATSLMANYANTLQRTEADQRCQSGRQKASGFIGPASQASGLTSPSAQAAIEDARARNNRYVRTYGNVRPVNASYPTSSYGTAACSNAVYQTTANTQSNKLPNQTVYPRQVTAVVRGTIVSKPTDARPAAWRAQQGQLGVAASSTDN